MLKVESEGKMLLQTLAEQGEKLEFIGDDVVVDDTLRATGIIIINLYKLSYY